MNRINNVPLAEEQKAKLENYFKNWENEQSEECVNFLTEVLNEENVKGKAIDLIIKNLGHLLKGKEELKTNLNSLKTERVREAIVDWLNENIEDYLEDGESTDYILDAIKQEVETTLIGRAISEIKFFVAETENAKWKTL